MYCLDMHMYSTMYIQSNLFTTTHLVPLKIKCCYNQVAIVTRTFSIETIESVPAKYVVVKRLML